MKTIAVYPGRFQPFHKGHAQVYKWLKSKFGNATIATSNKVEAPKSPFTFTEKKKMMDVIYSRQHAPTDVKNTIETLANSNNFFFSLFLPPPELIAFHIIPKEANLYAGGIVFSRKRRRRTKSRGRNKNK